MHEKVLLFGGPGTGKTHHLIETCRWLADQNKEMWVLDLEDKVEAFTHRQGGIPENMHLAVALSWEEIRGVIDAWKGVIPKDNWVAVDRVDLAWPWTQRWYTQQRFQEEMADRMLESAKTIKASSMQIPRFAEGAWQVINEQYDYFICNILYLYRCNVLLTAGVRLPIDESPFEVFSDVGVMPRGQKELPHQPHTALLLSNKVEKQRGAKAKRSWHCSTAKDLPGRSYVVEEPLFSFPLQYLEQHWE